MTLIFAIRKKRIMETLIASQGDQSNASEYVNYLNERLRLVHKFARINLQLTSDMMKVRFDNKEVVKK